MEEKRGLINRYEELHNLGIVIPCSHDDYTINPTPGDDSCSSSTRFEVSLNYDDYQNLVYYHTNGRRMVIKRKLPPKKGLLINPFCILCRVDIVKDLVTSKKNIFVGDWLMTKLNTLSDEIWEEVESLKKQGGQSVEHESNFLKQIEIPDLRLDRIVSDRVCNEEEFEACVAANDRVFEEKILVIKGLESLSIDDDDDVGAFLKREDMCGICLQKLKTTENKEGKNLKALSFITKRSKSLGKLPCEHVFHEPCILRWLYKNNVCPFCRNPVNV